MAKEVVDINKANTKVKGLQNTINNGKIKSKVNCNNGVTGSKTIQNFVEEQKQLEKLLAKYEKHLESLAKLVLSSAKTMETMDIGKK